MQGEGALAHRAMGNFETLRCRGKLEVSGGGVYKAAPMRCTPMNCVGLSKEDKKDEVRNFISGDIFSPLCTSMA